MLLGGSSEEKEDPFQAFTRHLDMARIAVALAVGRGWRDGYGEKRY